MLYSSCRALPIAAGVLLGVISLAVAAQQSPPDAGVILRTEPRVPDQLDRGPDIEQILRKRRGVQDVESFRLDVRSFTVRGLTVLSEEQAQAVLAPFKGPDKGFQDLLDAASALRRRLAEDGYFLADVIIPEQTVTNGWVELVALEGRIGEVTVDFAPNVTINKNLVEGFLSRIKSGEVARQQVVERAIFLINDLKGISASATFKPGARQGFADLEVLVQATPPANGYVDFDINGIESSGEYRYGLSTDFNNLFRYGGALNIRLSTGFDAGLPFNKDDRFSLGRIGMTLPVSSTGLRAALSYSMVRYNLDPFTVERQLLDGTGRVKSANLFYPLIRSRNTNLGIGLQFDGRSFDDRSKGLFGGGGSPFDNSKEISAWILSLSFDKRDLLLGGGLTFASLGLTRGDLSILTPTLQNQDSAGLRTAGSYEKYNLSAGRFQQLAPSWILLMSVFAQTASKNLDGTEQVILGGPYGIRALSPLEGRGDQSYQGTAELRRTFSEGGSFGSVVGAVFYDFGAVWRNKDPIQTDLPNRQWNSGVGIGLYWEPKGWFIRASLARITSPLPRPIDEGQGAFDFRSRSPRLYVQVLKYF